MPIVLAAGVVRRRAQLAVCLAVLGSAGAALCAAPLASAQAVVEQLPGSPPIPAVRPAPPLAAAPPAEQLSAWIEALDDERFLAREEATEQLRKVGLPALAALEARLPQQSLEGASRALAIVQHWGLARDPDLQEAALLALQRQAVGGGPMAQRAGQMLAKLQETRRALVLRELEDLGAKIHRRTVFDGVTTEEVIDSVEIGPGWMGQPNDLRRLSWLSGVNQLAFVGPGVRDAELQAVAAVEGVRSLQVYRAKISGEALAALLARLRPTSVGVYYTEVGDEVGPALERLVGVTTLRLYGTRVTPAVKDKLQGLLAAKIDYRLGGFLGVGCITVDGQCVISRVQEKSPAEQHGIKADDVVVRVGEQAVAGFEDLTAAVSQVRSGESTALEIERLELDDGGQVRRKRLKLKIPLAEWDVSQFVGNPLSD